MIDYIKLCLLFVHRENCCSQFRTVDVRRHWSRSIRIFIREEDSRDFLLQNVLVGAR